MPPQEVVDPGLLTNTMRDWLTILGFLGSMASILGIVVAGWQLWKTKNATQAIQQSLAESRQKIDQWLITQAFRLLDGASENIVQSAWTPAAVRLREMSHLLRQLKQDGDEWRELITWMDGFASTCTEMATGKGKRFPETMRKKWREAEAVLRNSLSKNQHLL